MKSPEQVVAELDALRALGARGTLFFVDDNFVGNRGAVARLLPVLRAWQEQNGFPFVFCTEASIDLATHPELVTAMVDAGFGQVFVGIETPSSAALAEAGKTQNLRMPQERAVEELTRAGLEVYAGFIVGFDSDGPDIFDRQLAFISGLPIARAMVNLLMALPGTQLWRRLEREGRLRGVPSGDSFERPNFVPALDERTLLAGYRLLAALYAPDAYLRRCALHLDQVLLRRSAVAHSVANDSIGALGRAVWRLGIRGPRRQLFWRLMASALRRGPAALPRAVMFAIVGESLIRYTEEVVLPRIDASLSELDDCARRRQRARPRRRRAARPCARGVASALLAAPRARLAAAAVRLQPTLGILPPLPRRGRLGLERLGVLHCSGELPLRVVHRRLESAGVVLSSKLGCWPARVPAAWTTRRAPEQL